MWILAGFALAAHVVNAQQAQLRNEYPWYSTGDEIHSTIKDLSENCPGADFQVSTRSAVNMNGGENAGQPVDIDVVRITKTGSPGARKAFLVFGEHARELISPETGLHFMKTLCGQGSGEQRKLVERVLGSTSFVVLPNANPLGRKRVEAGEYCQRTNEDGVDLNRNWGDQHRDNKRANKDDEMNPGPEGFSEPETQVIRDVVREEDPDIFLSIHSGAYFMGTPFGYTYSDQRKPSNEDEMTRLLAPISEKYCDSNCPYGVLSDMIGYKSIGCDIDWVKEQLNTPYTFTWEIYVGPEYRQYYIESARAHSENREMNAEAQAFFFRNALNLFQKKVVTRKHQSRTHTIMPESQMHPLDCFEQFNPMNAAETQQVTESWTGAFLTLCDEVASKGTAQTNSSSASQADGSPSMNPNVSPSSTDNRSSGSGAISKSQDTSQGTESLPKDADSIKQMSQLFDKQPQAESSPNADVSQASIADRSSGPSASSNSQDASQNPVLHDREQLKDTDPLPRVGFLSAFDSLKQWSEENH